MMNREKGERKERGMRTVEPRFRTAEYFQPTRAMNREPPLLSREVVHIFYKQVGPSLTYTHKEANQEKKSVQQNFL